MIGAKRWPVSSDKVNGFIRTYKSKSSIAYVFYVIIFCNDVLPLEETLILDNVIILIIMFSIKTKTTTAVVYAYKYVRIN